MRSNKNKVGHWNSKSPPRPNDRGLAINTEFILFMKVLRLFGMVPLKFIPTSSGRCVIGHSWVLSAYSYVFILIAVGVPAYTTYKEFAPEMLVTPADKLVKIFEYSSMAACFSTVLLTMNVKTKNLIEFLSFISQIEENFEMPRPLRSTDRRMLVVILVAIVFGILVDLQDLYDNLLAHPRILIEVIVLNVPYKFLFQLCALVMATLVFLMWGLEARSAAVVEELQKHIDERTIASQDDERLLHQLQRLQTRQIGLRRCAECINSGFGLTLLSILVFMLLQSIIAIYYLIADLNEVNIRTILLNVQWVIYLLFWVLMVVEPCHRFAKKDELTTDMICRIMIDIGKADELACGGRKKPRIEILWSQQMLLRATAVRISSLGITVVDRGLLCAFASYITTFLVILLQFNEQEFEEP